MPTSVGPNTFGEENLVFGYDLGDYPNGWGLTQLLANSEFTSQASPFTFASAFTNVNYLGQYKSGSLTGNSFIFSGGDSANYSVSQPAIWGWDKGYIGSTGGNWVYANILPNVSQSAVDYIVDCKWRFHYVSRLGSGSLDPTFQIGRAYTAFFQRSFSATGNSYDWQYTKFKFNGAEGGSSTNREFVLGLSSADSAIEVDYLRVYRIEKATGLRDLAGRSAIDLSNVSFNSSAQMTFDGTDDWLNAPVTLNAGNFTYETVMQANSTEYKILTAGTGNPTAGSTLIQSIVNSSGALINLYNPVGVSGWQYGSYSNLSGYTGVANAIRHIVVVNTANNWKTYVNGVLVGNTNLSVPTVGNAVGIARTGMQVLNPVATTVHAVKIYSRPLTAEEIRSNFNAVKKRFNI